MNQDKLSMNALLLIVLIFSAIGFVFTMLVSGLEGRIPVNDFYRIEGTDYAIVYSNRKTNGLYEGPEQTCELRLEGTFGHDWGMVLEEPYLYIDEYTYSTMGLIHCSVVRVDLRSFEKQTLFQDAILRGRCQSGELVCVTGFLMPSTFPQTNAICHLYGMTVPGITPGGSVSQVVFLDPATAEVVGSVAYDETADEQFQERYLDRTMDDILEEAGR